MRNTKKYTTVLTIAGSDSSGGAGIQADIKTISALGCYAASVITALTAQNTQGVHAIQTIPASFIQQQLDCVFTDLNINAVKIGMLHDAKVMDVTAQALAKYQPKHIILDPVMVAKNGCQLLEENTIQHFKTTLFPHCTLVTPNIPEAEVLLDKKILNQTEMEAAANHIGQEFKTNVLLKGGHLNMPQASDVLYDAKKNRCHWLHAERIITKNTHGTGCTLSSAIASYLALDYALHDAIAAAKHYLTQAIQAGKELQLGHGNGPVNHFYASNIAKEPILG